MERQFPLTHLVLPCLLSITVPSLLLPTYLRIEMRTLTLKKMIRVYLHPTVDFPINVKGNLKTTGMTWCFSDRASLIDYILNTNLMHWLLFIHKILFSSTCFEPQVLIFRRIQLYMYSIWYCHSLWEFLVACRYTAWVSVSLKRCTDRPPRTLIESDSTICCTCTTVSSWRWALEARNM